MSRCARAAESTEVGTTATLTAAPPSRTKAARYSLSRASSQSAAASSRSLTSARVETNAVVKPLFACLGDEAQSSSTAGSSARRQAQLPTRLRHLDARPVQLVHVEHEVQLGVLPRLARPEDQ